MAAQIRRTAENHERHGDQGAPVASPCVSVVMAVYNCVPFVQASIDSIVSQTFTDWEFIIVDDGSSDGTSGILSEFSSDARFKIIRQENMGVAKSLNRGVRHASGKYIARQDADDISLPTRFEAQVGFLEQVPDVGMVGTWAEWTSEDGTCCLQLLDYPTDDDAIQELLLRQCCFTHGSVMLRRVVFEAVGGYCEDFPLAQDYDLWLRIAEKSELANLPEVLYRYRKTRSGLSCRFYLARQPYKQMAQERAFERRKGHDSQIPCSELRQLV